MTSRRFFYTRIFHSVYCMVAEPANAMSERTKSSKMETFASEGDSYCYHALRIHQSGSLWKPFRYSTYPERGWTCYENKEVTFFYHSCADTTYLSTSGKDQIWLKMISFRSIIQCLEKASQELERSRGVSDILSEKLRYLRTGNGAQISIWMVQKWVRTNDILVYTVFEKALLCLLRPWNSAIRRTKISLHKKW